MWNGATLPVRGSSVHAAHRQPRTAPPEPSAAVGEGVRLSAATTRIRQSHRFQRKKKYGITAATTISTSASG
ncbi:MAG: hypothetical protein JWR08_2040 [Enterovirga sp.]|nr:hypothetical protein [Enterovirga sp.]